MTVIKRCGLVAILLLVFGFGTSGASVWAQSAGDPQERVPPPPEPHAAPPLEGPRTGVEALPSARSVPEVPDPDRSDTRTNEAQGAAATPRPGERVYVPHEPPPPIAERPSGTRPDRKAVWTPGHWEWDPDGDRFVWAGGTWRVPPGRSVVWMPGRWIHDARGWYWVPGAWGRTANRPAFATNRPAWRTSGPPAEQPDDIPPRAPGPDTFYIAGHYAPTAAGDRLAWVPGFWTDVQPGWDWIPARWIRRPDGWDFREGRWIRDPAAAVVVGQTPGRMFRRARRNAGVTVVARDPITGAEVDVEADGAPMPLGAVVTGVPYYVIRPPGAYPYGPNGVIVPGTVPPFVRRMLDRVLP